MGIFRTNIKKKYEKFEPATREELVQKRLEFLNAKPKNKKTEKKVEILHSLLKLFQNNQNAKDLEIYDVVKKHTEGLDKNSEIYEELSPFNFIKRYSKREQYSILPETMQSEFDDIPDENGMSKFEVVETIQRFGEILNNITNKERDLNSKLDCSLYAEQFLDTLEQIATLYHKRVIPKKAADYFENKFAYGINLLDWYEKYVNETKLKFDPNEEIFEDEENEERWREFKWFCRGGDTISKKISAFDDNLHVLPKVMEDYNSLPNEEGLTPSEVLEIMRDYSRQLTDLSSKETELQTKIDCSVYAEQYLDILEQIAYLFNNNALATDQVTYFENNFSYGKTLQEWYSLAVIGAEEQQGRWTEFDKYCDNFKLEDDEPKEIEPFNIESTLPTAMLYYQDLPTDKNKNKYTGEPSYKLKS